MKLSYCQPACKWEQTIPIGNGSLGAMVWGTVEERLGLNLDTLWSGYEHDKNNYNAFTYLSEARRLIFEGNYEEAENLIEEHMLGEYNESYLPLGDLCIQRIPQEKEENLLNAKWVEIGHNGAEQEANCSCRMDKIQNYRRELDLETATTQIFFEDEMGGCWKREYIASYPDKAIIGHYTWNSLKEKEGMNLSIVFQSQLQHEVKEDNDALVIYGQCPEHVDPNYIWDGEFPIVQGERGMKFAVRIKVLECDGAVETNNGRILIKNSTTLTFALSAICPVKKEKDFDLVPIFSKEIFIKEKDNQIWKYLLQRHVKDYQSLYQTVSIYLGEQKNLPTDKRLRDLENGVDDPGIYALYFQYGRYLLIASSREGSQPANLQGIWSWEFRAPWSSNWTTNINTEMNYWPVDICNLSPCFEPYVSFMKRICENGKKTAKIHYGCRGFVHHHNADYWCSTNPVGIAHGEEKGRNGATLWSFWPMGGVWLCQELYRHYEYQPDGEYLKDTLYPILKEAALFLVDWVVEQEGVYTTCPSTSPENSFYTKRGNVSCVASGTAMDLCLIQELWSNFESVCKKLEIDETKEPLLTEIQQKKTRLQPFQIGSYGQLLEWNEEFKEAEPGHRHLSPIYGLYPGELWENDEKLKEASRILLKHRLKNGGGYTGWSCAWIINLFAILEDGEMAYEYLHTLLTRSTYDNMWDAHPPFQIDGNFGGIAGIAAMLVQDRGGKVKILPALPKEWKDGYVKGLRIKGGKTIDITWKDGVAVKTIIHEKE